MLLLLPPPPPPPPPPPSSPSLISRDVQILTYYVIIVSIYILVYNLNKIASDVLCDVALILPRCSLLKKFCITHRCDFIFAHNKSKAF